MLWKTIKGERAITCNTALKFEKYLGTSPGLWLGFQKRYDLIEEAKRRAENLYFEGVEIEEF